MWIIYVKKIKNLLQIATIFILKSLHLYEIKVVTIFELEL